MSLMKGKVWSEHKHKLLYPVIAEIKHDEIRCHVIVHDNTGRTPFIGVPEKWVEFLSFSGKPLSNLDQWEQDFVQLSIATGWKEFDCGFLANNNFNDSYRWVRSTKNFPPELEGKPCKFLLFDLPESAGDYSERMLQRAAACKTASELNFTNLHFPEWGVCSTEAEVDATFLRVRELGHEGLMVKNLTHKYLRGKRIDGWLKMKPENDADGVITALHEAISEAGDPLRRVGSVSVRMQDGSIASPHGIAHELGREMFEHPMRFIGQWCEFNYMERDRQGGYRHPTFHRIREAK